MLDRAHRFHGLNALNFAHSKGQVVRGSLLSLKYIHNPRRQTYRVAVVVSRKVSKSAVVRNRIRRRVYEVVRDQASHITEPYDLVFMVYSADVAELDIAKLRTNVADCLHKAGAVANGTR